MPQQPPVFYDPREDRWRRAVRLTSVVGLTVALISTLFVLGLFVQPLLGGESLSRHLRHAQEAARTHGTVKAQALASQQLRKLQKEIGRERPRRSPSAARGATTDLALGFYVNDQDTGITSLRAHADQLTHLCPQWLFLTADGQHIDDAACNPRNEPVVREVLSVCRSHQLPIVPMLVNYANGWQADRLHRLLINRARHREFAESLLALLRKHQFQGVNIDFESVSPADRDNLTHLVTQIHAVLNPAGLVVCQDVQAVPLDDPENYAFDLHALSQVNDFIVVMAYDQHEEDHEAGPICGIDWLEKQWRFAIDRVTPDRLVLAIGCYAYDWREGKAPATDLTYQGALTQCADNHDDTSAATFITYDATSLNPFYDYEDDDGRPHRVWFLDAVTAANAWTVARHDHPRGAALWVLGSEDPTVWTFFDRAKMDLPIDVNALEHIAFPYEVDYEGAGEILQVKAEPRSGLRHLETDATSRIVTDMTYKTLPSSYVINRSGKQKGMVALTFDDGPDEQYTGPILDVLKQHGVAATFFMVGDNVARLPWLARRVWDEGHELANHTFFHPNLAHVSDQRVLLEVNATQLAIEAVTGHSTLEFRAPYSADAEPRTSEEVRPLVLVGRKGAQKGQSYVTVGESVDPKDWDAWSRGADNEQRLDANGAPLARTAQEIANYTISEVVAQRGNIVLLHDAGGDRTQTIAALPRIITELRKHGYRFVTVSELLNRPPRSLNPPVSDQDRLLVDFEGWVLALIFGGQRALRGAFMIAIVLGIARVAVMVVLALIERLRARRPFDAAWHPSVSVVIAAYNEEKVVCRTVETVLASDYDALEVIVVDDGSTDATSAALEQAFGGEVRVRLVRQENGGKASALNNGITQAKGEIIVSLDADTLFEPQTVSRLVRHFSERTVGAVAGNVKVGNRVNTITRWQAIEYITSQNLDRRAYSLLNAVSVVPGAVGAWRREALEQAGGYTTDTLAEDTDLTWKMRCNGWRIETDTEAVAWTEAPDTLSAFFKQRFRWSYGILQALFKHRAALLHHGWFGWVALPLMWVYQFLFQVISPLIDLQIGLAVLNLLYATLWPSTTEIWWAAMAYRDLQQIGFYYGLFFVVELCGALIAFWLDRERPWLLAWLFVQRFVYRQLMYAVVFKTLLQALRGRATGWGKLERKNTARTNA